MNKDTFILNETEDNRLNRKRKNISGIYQLEKPEYGSEKLDANGNPIAREDAWHIYPSDDNGFDKRCKFNNGNSYMDIVLTPGLILARYGSANGRFLTAKGTPFNSLSLPYKEDSMEYHEYEVVRDFAAVMGLVAPNFGREGGGVQFMTHSSVHELQEQGHLNELIPNHSNDEISANHETRRGLSERNNTFYDIPALWRQSP